LQAVLEMMHHVRKQMTSGQVLRCIGFAEAGLMSTALPTNVHVLCVRILSSMAEVMIMNVKSPTLDMDTKVSQLSLRRTLADSC
jgi:hypothetical protein